MNQSMVKKPPFGTSHGLLTCLLSVNTTDIFSDYFVLEIFGHFLLPLEEKNKFIECCTKLSAKQTIILSSK